ncbi:ABC transporter permease [Puia sp.]|jgi:lipoprotein-releasing system permease protein|uniref:ABC transporter permease n=1 Tax=Puia sp. TaxID=2045100 RepID=UPI002F428C33
MNFLFAWRYFRAKKSTNAINIIAWVSVSAIVVGAASLILVLSVFNGFEDLVKSLYTSFYPDIKVSPISGKNLTLTADQIKKLRSVNGVGALSLVAEDKGILENEGAWVPAYIKGVDANYTKVSGVGQTLERGKFETGTGDHPQAILGSGIANTLGVEAEKELLPLGVYLFRRGSKDYSADPMASMNHEALATSGMFRIQQDFDEHYVITNIEFVKRMVGLGPNEYSGAELSVTDPEQAPVIKQAITQLLGAGYKVQTRYEQNQSLYNVMGTEKWVIYIVLSLILIVAAFNMVGALTMLVWEKQKDIHVLKALGANNGMIQRIFLTEGLLLALMGGIGGILLAVIVCVLQIRYKLIPLQGGSFLIDYYPVKLVATDFLLVLSTIGVIALLASWLPARRAAAEPIALK